jgi:hypothetical protein
MIRADLHGYLAIISTKRPQNVSLMQHLVGNATWYVGKNEAREYQQRGASSVLEGGALCPSRNRALHDAWEHRLPCIQLSDDLTKLQQACYSMHKCFRLPLSFPVAVKTVLEEMEGLDARLGGVSPTDNLLNYNPRRPVATSHFILGDFMVVRPCTLFFDERFSLKEDYDYTLQHLMQYGIVARCDSILASFIHRTNAGGAASIRTPQREDTNIALLKHKWKQCIADHPRAEHEVLLKWRKPDISRQTIRGNA